MEEQTNIEKNHIRVDINTEWCKGCGICIEFCPKKVLIADCNNKAVWYNANDCIRCGLCEMRCPDAAIMLIEEVQ